MSGRERYVVERHDNDDGSITYEIWDYSLDHYRRLCSINEWDDGQIYNDPMKYTAKNDAEMIVRALNEQTQKPRSLSKRSSGSPPDGEGS